MWGKSRGEGGCGMRGRLREDGARATRRGSVLLSTGKSGWVGTVLGTVLSQLISERVGGTELKGHIGKGDCQPGQRSMNGKRAGVAPKA